MTIEPTASPVGRPTKYRPDYHPVWVEKLAKLGATDIEIAEAFEVSTSTIRDWIGLYPEFSLSRKKGKMFADAEVASKLFHRATGYEHPDVDIKVVDGQIVITDLVKHYAPDTTAAIFWLKNRQPAKWRDRPPEATDNDESKPVKVVVEVKDARKPDADA